MLALYCLPREAEFIDDLADLLLQIVHQFGTRAERNVIRELINDFVKVNGKTNILYRLAEAVHDEPDGLVRDVVYPVVGEETIANLVNLVKEFRSNNAAHRQILDAVDVIKAHRGNRRQYFTTDDVPIDGVVRAKWHEVVVEVAPDGSERVNRINYEIHVLQELRERLRCKEIWIVDAGRYRNPDHDLPHDVDDKRQEYYGNLNLTSDPQEFVLTLRDQLAAVLTSLNGSLPHDPKVRIKHRGGKYHISITPFEALSDPPNLGKLKTELGRRWPATGLLDTLKEPICVSASQKRFQRPEIGKLRMPRRFNVGCCWRSMVSAQMPD